MNQEEKAFIIRAYDKAELAELYSPGRTAAAALQTLYRWMRRNMLLQEELNEAIKEAMKLRKEGKNVALRPSKEEQD